MSIYLSASGIADFIKCSQRVLYRITKPFPETPNREMKIGKIAHLAVEKGWKDRAIASAIIKDGVHKERLTRTEQTNLEFMVDLFHLNFKPLLREDDLIEYMFKIPMFDDVFLVGKMDRISNGNIYDWKTSGKISKNTGRDVQCIIYNYAYKILFKKYPASICLASLSNGQLFPYMESELHTKELFETIIPRMIRTIKNGRYERLGLFNHSCFRCQYKEGCLGGVEDVLDYPELIE